MFRIDGKMKLKEILPLNNLLLTKYQYNPTSPSTELEYMYLKYSNNCLQVRTSEMLCTEQSTESGFLTIEEVGSIRAILRLLQTNF